MAWYCHTVGVSVYTIVACVYTNKQLERLSEDRQGCVSIWTIRAYFYTNVIRAHLYDTVIRFSMRTIQVCFIRSFFIRLFFELHVFVNCYSGNVICARGCITRNILYINRQIHVWLRYNFLCLYIFCDGSFNTMK